MSVGDGAAGMYVYRGKLCGCVLKKTTTPPQKKKDHERKHDYKICRIWKVPNQH